MHNIQQILAKLISFASITPKDEGCQEYMIEQLESLGFSCERMNNKPVANFFARIGNKAPLLIFAGHTDVVPVGNVAQWHNNPFSLTEHQGMLFGRGVADMKGSLAAMLIMAERFVTKHKTFNGSLGFLITSGEEGDDYDKGTPFVMSKLHQLGICPNYCVVGEPSSTKQIGDVIKVGRRGSLTGKLTLQGKQGHVAYPHLAINPIHLLSPVLNTLTKMHWDAGNNYFPPTTFQITHIQSGGEANNIIPGDLNLHFNFRYSTEQTAEQLKRRVMQCFKEYSLNPTIEWRLSGEPFLTTQGALINHCQQAILQHTGLNTELSTSGGTSDGRFIAPYGVEVIELGPINATIHQVNECVVLKDLEILTEIYLSICEGLLVKNK
jgi:succinyl-diaminopimelate desuccinylase